MPPTSIYGERRELLTNVDWTDVAGATGFILYDGWGARISTGNDYFLIDTTNRTHLFGDDDSGTILNTGGSGSTSSTSNKLLDLDFDLSEFQLPRTIKGIATVKIGINFTVGGAVNFEYFAIIKIRKWDGSSETEIASVQSVTFTTTTNVTDAITLPLTIPLTHFKKGEQIRLTVSLWGKNDDNSTSYNMVLGHNPLNTVIGVIPADNSRLVAAIPFRMDNL